MDENQNPENHVNLADSVNENKSEDATQSAPIYGVAEPEKTFHPGTYAVNRASTQQTQEVNTAAGQPGNAHTSDKSENDLSDEETEPLSLDELYERKRRERLELAEKDTGYDFESQRRSLPLYPFVSGILTPFFRPAFALRFLIVVAAGLFPFYLATLFFSHMLMDKYLEEGYKLVHFLGGIWNDKNILFLFCFFGGVVSIPYSLYVFDATAEGDDEMQDWPEFNVIGGFGQFLWVALLIIISGTPGYFVGLVTGVPTAGFLISSLFFTPILFLSCKETDTLFTLITPSITRSLVSVWKGWGLFYCASGILFFVTVAAGVCTLWRIQVFECAGWIVLLASVVVSALFSFAPMVYLRLLGRLGWMIAQERRLNPPPAPSDSREEKSGWENVVETFRKFH